MPQRKTVLVAGATGILGVHVVQQLVANEYDVIGLTRSPAKRTLLEGFGAQAVTADVLDAAALAQVLHRTAPTAVIDLLTALPSAGPLRPSQLEATNHLRVTGTANLVRASIAAGVRRIVGESFTFVYGFGGLGDAAKTEADAFQAPQAQPRRQAAVDALRSLEHQLLAAQHQGAIEAIVLRYGVLYGPDVPTTQAILRALRWRVLPRVRGVDGLTSFIHIADATSATLAALEHGRPGAIYNIVDDEPASMENLVGDAARHWSAASVCDPLAVAGGGRPGSGGALVEPATGRECAGQTRASVATPISELSRGVEPDREACAETVTAGGTTPTAVSLAASRQAYRSSAGTPPARRKTTTIPLAGMRLTCATRTSAQVRSSGAGSPFCGSM